MTSPTIVPVEYDNTSRDFLKVKEDRSGAQRLYDGQVSIASGTAALATIGLIPFNKGAQFHLDNTSVYVDDLDTGTTVTLSLGYIYDDNTNNTNNLTAWTATSTIGQAAGFLAVAGTAGLTFRATANGWVVVQFLTGPTTTTGNVTFQIAGSYDGLGIDNQNNQN